MDEYEKYYISLGMKERGGSFVKYLGMALIRADPSNARKIKEAFPEYCAEYYNIGKQIHENSHKT